MRRTTDLSEAPGHRLGSLMISEGESTTMSMLLVAFEMLAPLHGLIGTDLSVYGSYAGIIILTDRVEGIQEGQASLGDIDMTAHHNAFGRQVDSYGEDLIAPELGAGPNRPLRAIFIRAPWMEEVDPGVEILATARAGHAARVGRVGGGRITAVHQGSLPATPSHPEVGSDHQVRDILVSVVVRRT